MKSITIHNLDDSLDILIRKKAKKNGLSLSKTIKLLLKESLGLKQKNLENHESEFIDFCGMWSENDEIEFEKNVNDLSEIDELDWT